jgi:heme-degrading monooxygenase HmoA
MLLHCRTSIKAQDTMTATPVLQRRAALSTLPVLALAAASPAAGLAPLDDPDSVITVMQFAARSEGSRAKLKLPMAAMRDHLRAQQGLLENVLFENRNPTAKLRYRSVSPWKSFKDWQNLGPNPKAQALDARIGEVGDLVPGTFGVVK